VYRIYRMYITIQLHEANLDDGAAFDCAGLNICIRHSEQVLVSCCSEPCLT